jgi:heat shock protein HslJ
MKKILIGIVVILVLIAGFYALNAYIYNEKQGSAAEDYKDAEYVIDGVRVKLENGFAETESAPGSASKATTRYFGNEIRSDLNSDGREDIVFLLTQETGGSGVFYYVVASLNTDRGYVGSEALFLGDRIAPQTTEKGNGKIIVVNYADRKLGEDFSIEPSQAKSIWLLLDASTMQFGEVEKNFEGEADPSRMSLGMKSWTWISALYNDGREVKPKKSGVFTISFGNDGNFSATTDCNSMGGKYTTDTLNKTINFSEIMSTKMYCVGSQEEEFETLLQNTQNYHFTSRGELVLDLKFDSGSVIFK